MNPVLPASTSTPGFPSRWFVLCTVMGRRPIMMLYSGVRITDAMRSSLETNVMSRAMSYADDTLSESRPDGSA